MAIQNRVMSGMLVALEGDSPTIATQLQLLPRASNVLVLPPLSERIPKNAGGDIPFNPRAYVRSVLTALLQQTELARTFLQGSPVADDLPRLALVNGGSIAARTACITKFSEKLTQGDVEEAEKLLETIVKDGAMELLRVMDVGNNRQYGRRSIMVGNKDSEKEVVAFRVMDSTSKAMEAAEYLDRQTEALQEEYDVAGNMRSFRDSQTLAPWGHGLHPTRRTSHRASQNSRQTTPPPRASTRRSRFSDQESSPTLGGRGRRTYCATRLSMRRSDIPPLPESPISTSPDLETDDGTIGSDDDTSTVCSARSGRRNVRYSEDTAIEPLSELTTPHRSRSTSPYPSHPPRPSSDLAHRRQSWVEQSSIQRSASMEDLNALKASTNGAPAFKSSSNRSARTTYRPTSGTDLDTRHTTWASTRRGTHPTRATETGETLQALLNPDSDKEVVLSNEPVFEVTEDMIIYIPSGTEGNFLDAVFDSYIDGPADHLRASLHESPSTLASEKSPRTPTEYEPVHSLPLSKFAIPSVRDHEYDDFDPYRAIDNDPPSPSQYSVRTELAQPGPMVEITPTIRAPPGLDANKIHVLQHKILGTAVELQSSLRAFLREHFPTYESHSSHQYFASLDPEKLWDPVFSDPAIPVSGKEYKTLDQIIAVGAEDGVNKEFLSQTTGQIERLGCKRNGDSKSGRLDLRYLLTTAIASVDIRSPHMTAMMEPTLDARLLATLLVPQLETYLATNTSVRFLCIQYPSSHLPIVLALRELIGSDLMRVAGLLDSASEPLVMSSRLPNPLSKTAIAACSARFKQITEDEYLPDFLAPPVPRRAPGRSTTPNETVSFVQVDYLLPSNASDAETKVFLDSIAQALLKRSIWYTPEPSLLPPLPPTPMLNKPLPPARSTSNAVSTKAPKSILMNGFTGPKPGYASSIASSIRTVTTTYTTATEKSRKKRERQNEKDWENFYIGSEDEDDDDYDRMVMGRRGAKILPLERPKTGDFRNIAPTKKALKWLGLA